MSYAENEDYKALQLAKHRVAVDELIDYTDTGVKEFDKDTKRIEKEIAEMPITPNEDFSDFDSDLDGKAIDRKRLKELARREREKQKYKKKREGKPKLTKEQAEEQIRYFQLETERRAWERANPPETKSPTIVSTVLESPPTYVRQDSKGSFILPDEIEVVDRNGDEHIWVPKTLPPDQQSGFKTLHSFYSEKMQTFKTKKSTVPNSQKQSQPNSLSVTKKETEFAEIPEEEAEDSADQTKTDLASPAPHIKSQKTQQEKLQRKAE